MLTRIRKLDQAQPSGHLAGLVPFGLEEAATDNGATGDRCLVAEEVGAVAAALAEDVLTPVAAHDLRVGEEALVAAFFADQ